MNISDYIEKARSTAIYPGPFDYPTHGIAGEIGELIDKLTVMPTQKDEITKEIGDVLWYVVNTLEDAGMSLLNLAYSLSIAGVATNFTELGMSLLDSDDDRSSLIKLPVYSGRLNEIAKKMLRDSDGVMPEDKKTVVQDSVSQIVICLYDICNQLSINMDDVAQINIDKLFSRKKRGVLGGSGDNR